MGDHLGCPFGGDFYSQGIPESPLRKLARIYRKGKISKIIMLSNMDLNGII